MTDHEYENLFTTAEWRAFANHQVEEVLPHLKDSEVFVSMGSAGDDPDIRMAVELGMALLLGKPVVMVLEPGNTLPPGLTRAADKIIYGEIQHPNTKAKLMEAVNEILPEEP